MVSWKRIAFLAAMLHLLLIPVQAADTILSECWQGLSSDNAQWQECPLGDYTADAVRIGTGAQIALIPAELLGSPLVGDGSITEEDLLSSIPQDCDIGICTLTGPELKALLEQGVSNWTLTEQETLDTSVSASGDYLQISGCFVSLDASAPQGDRVISVTLDGAPVPLTDEEWTVNAALPDTLGKPSGQERWRLRELVRNHLISEGSVTLPEDGRVRVIGAHQRQIISYVSPGLIGIVVVIFALSGVLSLGRKRIR